MKILCLVDKYYPDSSANTICGDNIAKYFKEKGHSVDFLSIKTSLSDESYTKIGASNIFKIDTYHDKYLKKYGKKYNAKKWEELPFFVRKPLALMNKIRCFLRPSTGYVNLDCVCYRDIYKQVTNVCNHYDCIISLSMPFGLHVVARKLLKLGLADRWYAIFLDAFEYNKCLPTSKITYRKKLSKKILKDTNNIFFVDGLLSEQINEGYRPKYHSKLHEIYIPMLNDLGIEDKSQKDGNNVLLTYAGLFYPDIRRPDEMLEILSRLPSKFKIQLFGDGCEKIVDLKAKKFKENQLLRYGRVNHDKCIEELSKSDILLNLGNTITDQMPSKVFEYISMGKPIINFYFSEDDMCLKVFKKYPLVFNINVNKYTESDVVKLVEFCEEKKDLTLDFKEATKGLAEYLPENNIQKIYEVIMNR